MMLRDTRGLEKLHYERVSEFTPVKRHQFIMGRQTYRYERSEDNFSPLTNRKIL